MSDSSVPLISFSPYVFRKMGILQSGTYLRVENYHIISVPYRISVKTAVVLAALSAEETLFFRKYVGGHCGLYLTYENGARRGGHKLLIQTTLRDIQPVAGRRNLCLFTLSIRSCPEMLQSALTGFASHLAEIHSAFKRYAGKTLLLDAPKKAKEVGFNEYAEALAGKKEIPVRVLSFAMDRIVFLVSSVHGRLESDTALSLRLYFIGNRFTVKGTLVDTAAFGNIYKRYTLEIGFSPELTEILKSHFEVHAGKGSPADEITAIPYEYQQVEML